MARFGDAYGSAYTFGLALMEDSWKSTRPGVVQRVSGANGEFDFYADNAPPIAPVVATKKFAITSSVSSAAIEDALELLRTATISRSTRSKLWWLDRDGTTKYWAWAKCETLNAADTYKEKGRWLKNVTLTFRMSEGVWYGDTMQTWSETMVIPASTVGRAVSGLTNSGNVRALLDARIVPHDSLTMEDSAVGVFGISQWESAADVDDGEQLSVLASKYKTVNSLVFDMEDIDAVGAGVSIGVWGDGAYIYFCMGSDGIHSYSVDGSGNIEAVDSDDQGDTAFNAWGDGRLVYLANGTGGILSYSVDAAGAFSYLNFDDQGFAAYGVWGDGKFVYLANGAGGILSYSVNSAGAFTLEDTDSQGGEAFDAWGDGKFLYVADGTDGIRSYSVDSSGDFTYIDVHDPGGVASSVWGDGTFIYLASDSAGVHVYAVDGSGNLTLVDSDDQGDTADCVWGDGNFLFLANGAGGIHVYDVNEAGELTHIAFIDPGGSAEGIWGDGTFVYVANTNTVRSYSMNTETNAYADLDVGEGDLLDRPDINQVSWLWLPPGTHQTNVVVDCDAGGSSEEVDVHLTWWDTYVF